MAVLGSLVVEQAAVPLVVQAGTPAVVVGRVDLQAEPHIAGVVVHTLWVVVHIRRAVVHTQWAVGRKQQVAVHIQLGEVGCIPQEGIPGVEARTAAVRYTPRVEHRTKKNQWSYLVKGQGSLFFLKTKCMIIIVRSKVKDYVN